jgi:hypothetical protein
MTTLANIPSNATPPAWVAPDATPDYSLLCDGVLSWERLVSAAVWVDRVDTVADAGVQPGPDRIHVDCPEAGVDAAAARSLAAELLAAAELATRD